MKRDHAFRERQSLALNSAVAQRLARVGLLPLAPEQIALLKQKVERDVKAVGAGD